MAVSIRSVPTMRVGRPMMAVGWSGASSKNGVPPVEAGGTSDSTNQSKVVEPLMSASGKVTAIESVAGRATVAGVRWKLPAGPTPATSELLVVS